MIRITGGRFLRRTIESPPRNREVRPTTAMMRESIFNRLQQQIPGCRFLDLFAGSGIMGIEAISRGAAFVLAVELHPEQCRMIRKNYAKLGIPESQGKIIPFDVEKLLSKPCIEEGFDVIFLDPPYGMEKLSHLVDLCTLHGWLKPNGVIVVEHGSREPELPGFTRKIYGESALSIGPAH
jgi:16S rRNA (guanine966-N2)-methyltransferase